jgi:3-oxoacyl-[acyl-carrier-protein] synthase I
MPVLHIVAVSARCALGLTAESSAAAIRAGMSRLAEHPALTDPGGEPIRCARDACFDSTILASERMIRLADHALRQVVAKLTLDNGPSVKIPVWLALPEERPGFNAHDAEAIRKALLHGGIPYVARSINLVGRGHAGVVEGLCAAIERVSRGDDQVAVVGGVDSYLDVTTIAWLASNRRLAWSGARGGFPPGEGAAMFAIAGDSARRRLRLPSLGRVRHATCSQEARSLTSDEGLLGEGLSDAVLRATSDLQLPREAISDVYGDINGERHRTEDWGFTLTRVSERMRDGTEYVTAVGSVGDLGAATAALGCVLATQAWQRRYAAGSRALVWAGSWGGLRGAVTLEQTAG